MWRIFLLSALTVMLAEIACGVRTAALEAKTGHPWVVFTGTLVGTAAIMIVAVFCGEWLRSHVSELTLRYVAGATLAVIGVLICFGKIG